MARRQRTGVRQQASKPLWHRHNRVNLPGRRKCALRARLPVRRQGPGGRAARQRHLSGWSGAERRSGRVRFRTNLKRQPFWKVAPSCVEESLLAPRQAVEGLPAPSALIRSHWRSEEHTSELQSLMRISYAVLCLKKKTHKRYPNPSQLPYHYNTTKPIPEI